jgi:subtilisin family serine protease
MTSSRLRLLLPLLVLSTGLFASEPRFVAGSLFVKLRSSPLGTPENTAAAALQTFGSNFNSRTMNDIVDFAANVGTLVVCAAGNSNDDTPLYPAAYSSALSVASVDYAGSGDHQRMAFLMISSHYQNIRSALLGCTRVLHEVYQTIQFLFENIVLWVGMAYMLPKSLRIPDSNSLPSHH